MMRFILMLILMLGLQQLGHTQQKEGIAVIPAPALVSMANGNFIFSQATLIQTDVQDSKTVSFFTDYLLHNWKFKNKTVIGKGAVKASSVLVITDKGAEKLAAESYELSVSPAKITLVAKGAGLFYGIQTLIQLFPNHIAGTAVLPCVTINDHPRFGYRGLMLDVSRHFFTASEVKNLLDLMAQYKLNRFHWHLTDDQGWRIEIKSYPKLTTIGSWRVPRIDDASYIAPPQPGEAATDGGFYTQADIREIVQYAADRYIQIIPEIDVPGHCMAALAAYPELSVTKNSNTKVNAGNSFARWFTGGFEMYEDNTLNPTDEKVYQFLDKVFDEVAQLFPYEYIHIGGDECFKGFWEKDAGVQAFMQKNNIKTTHNLQRYFTSRVNQIIVSKHRKMIGWDEIMNDSLNSTAAVMNRFGEKGALEQVKKKLNIILAPGGNGLYFDYAQSRSDMEPSSHGGNAPLWKAYNYNPDYKSFSQDDKKYALGIEACVWTEHIPSVSKLYYMVLPRMLALAETGWTMAENKDYKRFSDLALSRHLEKFDRAGYNYWVPPAFNYTDTTLTGSKFRFELKPVVPGSKIYYTLNDRFPGEADHEYKEPLILTLPPNKKYVLKTIVVTPAGRRSVVTRTVMQN
ncbi:MAG: family 20 glycosylhydrolase [Mucilaginibacter sp.]|uniref:beta-N-acetylhexosaminidase n=1 Tax=Mucilaginibacter sp. TaxID=1882438 RepID=UPI0031A0D89D